MALAAASVIEVRTTGSDTNGGGWVVGASGSDLSQSDTAAYAATDLVTNGTTTVTSASSNWGTNVVGNFIYIAGGTGSIAANWYEIKTRVSASEITVDRSTGLTTGTGATGNVGGAVASAGVLGAMTVVGTSGMMAFAASGTYTATTSTDNVSGGMFNGQSNIGIMIKGYKAGAARTDMSEMPVFHMGSVTNKRMFDMNGPLSFGPQIINVKVDCNNGASNIGIDASNAVGNFAYKCEVINAPLYGFLINVAGSFVSHCKASACGTGFITSGSNTAFINCWGDGCTNGFDSVANGVMHINCLSTNNTGRGFYNNNAQTGMIYINCTAYGNGNDGFDAQRAGSGYISCLSTNNTGFGFDAAQGWGTINCATFSNTSGAINLGTLAIDNVTLSASPYIDTAGFNFTANSVAGGGQSIRGASITAPTAINFRDIGYAQHKDVTTSLTFVG